MKTYDELKSRIAEWCDREDPEAGIGQGSEYGFGLLRFWRNRFFVTIMTTGDDGSASIRSCADTAPGLEATTTKATTLIRAERGTRFPAPSCNAMVSPPRSSLHASIVAQGPARRERAGCGGGRPVALLSPRVRHLSDRDVRLDEPVGPGCQRRAQPAACVRYQSTKRLRPSRIGTLGE